jgi:hypothetical protein
MTLSKTGPLDVSIDGSVAEARRLKSGRWRLYKSPGLLPVRDPGTGGIATFRSLAEARRWWLGLDPQGLPVEEAVKCARCGAYFGRGSNGTQYAGRHYHPAHLPQHTYQ